MPNTRTFSKEYLLDLDLPNNEIQDEIYQTRRWSVDHSCIFEDPTDYTFWEVCYSVGATENQYEMPWEYDDEIVGVQVEKRTVTTMKWVVIE
jgi:hypothetical protein